MEISTAVKKAPLWLKIAVIAVVGVVLAPMALLLLKGVFAVVLASFLILVAIFGGPVLAEKMANWKIMGLKNEWEKNPVETLERQLVTKREDLQVRLKNIQEIAASVETVKSTNAEFRQRFPNSVNRRATLEAAEEKLVNGLEVKKAKYRATKQSVDNFAMTIEEVEAYWKAAKAVHKSAALDDKDNDPMELLKTKTSLGAVVESMNLAFAELDTALLDQELPTSPASLEAPKPVEVILASVPTKEGVKVQR